MDKEGKLRYVIGEDEYSFGYLTSYSENFNKSVSGVPLVNLSYKDTFGLESSSMINLSLSFVRVQPDKQDIDDTGRDSNLWSNRKWLDEMSLLIDRWQSSTDGGILKYEPSSTNPYVSKFEYRGYIKSLSRKYSKGIPVEIKCNMEFHVGTMYVNNEVNFSDPTMYVKPSTEYSILISDADSRTWYTLMSGNEYNCVSDYKIYGGSDEPFEYITLRIPKERLASVAPELTKPDMIIAGRNKLYLDAIGKSNMIISKCMLRGSDYIITAYCQAAILTGKNLKDTYSATPFNWIYKILCSGVYDVAFREGSETKEGNFVYSYVDKHSDSDVITFFKDENVWYILQVCAMYLGCKIFFANDCAYLIDYRQTALEKINSINPSPSLDHKILDLYTTNRKDPLYGRVVGDISLGNEGIDTIVNSQAIACSKISDGELVKTTFVGVDKKSKDNFMEKSGNLIRIFELIQGTDSEGVKKEQAKEFAEAYLDYRSEPQQSITFALKEVGMAYDKYDREVPSWSPFFDISTAVQSISSEINNIRISDESVLEPGKHKPQKMILSRYVRSYPEGKTQYSFGVISSIDLSSDNSAIFSSLNNA